MSLLRQFLVAGKKGIGVMQRLCSSFRDHVKRSWNGRDLEPHSISVQLPLLRTRSWKGQHVLPKDSSLQLIHKRLRGSG